MQEKKTLKSSPVNIDNDNILIEEQTMCNVLISELLLALQIAFLLLKSEMKPKDQFLRS